MVDLFCGSGGLSLGLQDEGFSVIAAADSDPVSIAPHAANIRSLTWIGDLSNPSYFIRQLDDWGIESVDLLAGGICAVGRGRQPRLAAAVTGDSDYVEDPSNSLGVIRAEAPRW